MRDPATREQASQLASLSAAGLALGLCWALHGLVPASGWAPGPAGADWLTRLGAVAGLVSALAAWRGLGRPAAGLLAAAAVAVLVGALWGWLGSEAVPAGHLGHAYGPRRVGWGLGLAARCVIPAVALGLGLRPWLTARRPPEELLR